MSEKTFYGIYPIFNKKTNLGFDKKGEYDPAKPSDIDMIVPSLEAAERMVNALSTGSYDVIDAPHGIAGAHHWEYAKLHDYDFEPTNIVWFNMDDNRVFSIKQPNCIKVTLNQHYAEGIVNA